MKLFKIVSGFCLAGAVGCLIGVGLMNRLREEEHLRFQTAQAAWQAEKAELQAAMERARAESAAAPIVVSRTQTVAEAVAARLTPAEIIARLQQLRGPSQIREAVYWLEELAHCGP